VQVPDAVIRFEDALQGTFEENLTESTGDFVLLRADGMFSYQLAVVVDDAWQGVTHVVRGADLLGSTARQIYLQGLLGCGQPEYLHLPVATNAAGEKLSKQTMAAPVEATNGAGLLVEALRFLGQCPPADLSRAPVRDVWAWAVESWDPATIPRVLEQPAPGPASE
jgi:glutamyl-Q tRNA(Asp) synthetase